jgi:prophage regulatory protein
MGDAATGTSTMENVLSESPAVERLIRFPEVKRLTGLSGATLYRKMSANEFPRPVRLGANACAWPLSEIQDWIAERIALRDTDDHGAAA